MLKSLDSYLYNNLAIFIIVKSKAAVLKEFGKPLVIENIDIQEPKADQVLIEVKGAGVCRTDLRIWKGTEIRPRFQMPIVLGHENAGKVVKVGEMVKGVKPGDNVIVYATWGCNTCRYCKEGKYNVCKDQYVPGQNTNGGFSEYMLVWSEKWLVKLNNLNPIEAAPLADAGTTSMGAVRQALPFIYEYTDPIVLVNGVGGVSSYAIQILKTLVKDITVIAISRSQRNRDFALELGADYAITLDEAKELVDRLSHGLGASVAIDMVGTEESLYKLTKIIAPNSAVVVVGLEGTRIAIPTFEAVVYNKKVLGSNYGTINDLEDVVRLAENNKIRSIITRRSLDEINEAFKDLDEGKIVGRQVIIP